MFSSRIAALRDKVVFPQDGDLRHKLEGMYMMDVDSPRGPTEGEVQDIVDAIVTFNEKVGYPDGPIDPMIAINWHHNNSFYSLS